MNDTVKIAARRLLELIRQRDLLPRGAAATRPPLIVGIQGPQGIGKTTLVKNLISVLAGPHEGLVGSPLADGPFTPYRPVRAVALSIDDLYLPHDALLQVKRDHPNNRLLHGRGLPGTHDLALGSHILRQLKNLSPRTDSDVCLRLPVYDKSLHDGAGDRLDDSQWNTVKVVSSRSNEDEPPLDLFLLEGWCLGFQSLPDDELRQRYQDAQRLRSGDQPSDDAASSNANLSQPLHFALQHPVESLFELNANLREYEREWYPHIDTFIQLCPANSKPRLRTVTASDPATYSALDKFQPQAKADVFRWRLEAEHWMKENVSDGKGMTDEQVRDFVARYMPAYELFSQNWLDAYSNRLSKGLEPRRNESQAPRQVPSLVIELNSDRSICGDGFVEVQFSTS
ncbi:hypothetical protein OC845_006342 [Tilletia horrida]|nr:hypothetical protein OC845_006342 [Tilletia horrida]